MFLIKYDIKILILYDKFRLLLLHGPKVLLKLEIVHQDNLSISRTAVLHKKSNVVHVHLFPFTNQQ